MNSTIKNARWTWLINVSFICRKEEKEEPTIIMSVVLAMVYPFVNIPRAMSLLIGYHIILNFIDSCWNVAAIKRDDIKDHTTHYQTLFLSFIRPRRLQLVTWTDPNVHPRQERLIAHQFGGRCFVSNRQLHLGFIILEKIQGNDFETRRGPELGWNLGCTVLELCVRS